jgi:Ni/Co efflux regulator RcnB
MKIGLSALLGAVVVSAAFAATSAGAVTLPANLKAENAVKRATFWVDDEKKGHPKKHKAGKKHHVAHAAKHPVKVAKKKEQKG